MLHLATLEGGRMRRKIGRRRLSGLRRTKRNVTNDMLKELVRHFEGSFHPFLDLFLSKIVGSNGKRGATTISV